MGELEPDARVGGGESLEEVSVPVPVSILVKAVGVVELELMLAASAAWEVIR